MRSIPNPKKDQAAWLVDRQSRITATDAAAIVGRDPYRSPLDVYLDKKGLAPERPMSEAAEWGLRLEGPILDAYAERTGRAIVATQQYQVHPAREWQAATVDAIADDGRIVEVKTIGLRSRLLDELGEPGTDEVPTSWLLQVQHQISVTGCEMADVAALVGGQELRIYHVARNDHLITKITDRERAFYERHILTNTPPDPSTADDVDAYQWIYPNRDGGVIWSDQHLLDLLTLYTQLGETSRDVERRRNAAKAELLAALADHERATTTDGRTVEAKIRHRAGYTVEPASYLYFSVKQFSGGTK